MNYEEEEVWEMTLGKIMTLYREYKNIFDLEESLKRNQTGYKELMEIKEKKENIIAF